MKIITTILTVGFLIIAACIVYILKTGVSIRTAPIIKPSIISPDFENVSHGIFFRLFPDIQQAHYVIWGLPQNNPEVEKTLALLKLRYETEFKTPVNIIPDGFAISNDGLKPSTPVENCKKPCWIYFPENAANELKPNPWIKQNIQALERQYFTISWIDFSRKMKAPDYCLKEKRLDFECLKATSVQEVERKLTNPKERYFFLRKYMDKDYFLFVEEKE